MAPPCLANFEEVGGEGFVTILAGTVTRNAQHPDASPGAASRASGRRCSTYPAWSSLRPSGVAQAPPKNSPRIEQTGPGPRAQRRASYVWLNICASLHVIAGQSLRPHKEPSSRRIGGIRIGRDTVGLIPVIRSRIAIAEQARIGSSAVIRDAVVPVRWAAAVDYSGISLVNV
jgi:hypothetical protein